MKVFSFNKRSLKIITIIMIGIIASLLFARDFLILHFPANPLLRPYVVGKAYSASPRTNYQEWIPVHYLVDEKPFVLRGASLRYTWGHRPNGPLCQNDEQTARKIVEERASAIREANIDAVLFDARFKGELPPRELKITLRETDKYFEYDVDYGFDAAVGNPVRILKCSFIQLESDIRWESNIGPHPAHPEKDIDLRIVGFFNKRPINADSARDLFEFFWQAGTGGDPILSDAFRERGGSFELKRVSYIRGKGNCANDGIGVYVTTFEVKKDSGALTYSRRQVQVFEGKLSSCL